MKILTISIILLLTGCSSSSAPTPVPTPVPPALTLEEQIAAKCNRDLPPRRYETCVQIWTERLSTSIYRN